MKIMAECMLYMYTHGYNYAMVLCEIPYIRIVLEIILVTIDIINIALYVNGKSINNIRREECQTTNTSIHKTVHDILSIAQACAHITQRTEFVSSE